MTKKITTLLCVLALGLSLLSGCGGTKNDSAPEQTAAAETAAPTVEPTVAPTPEPITEAEEGFLRTLLASIAVGMDWACTGCEGFLDPADLAGESIGVILAESQQIGGFLYSNTPPFLPATSGSTYPLCIKDAELQEASKLIFGRSVSVQQITAMSDMRPMGYNTYFAENGEIGRLPYNGRGPEPAAVQLSDVQYSGDMISLACQVGTSRYHAELKRTGSEKYPFQILSFLPQGVSPDPKELSVRLAYAQMMRFSVILFDVSGTQMYLELAQSSLLNGYTPDDLYSPIMDCYLLDLDADTEPELVVECGQAETMSYLLNYNGYGFDVTSSPGHPLQKYQGGYYTVQTIPGDGYEGQIYYQIDTSTLRSSEAERQSTDQGNYTFWYSDPDYAELPAVATNESRYFMVNDAVAAYYG